MTRAVRDVSPGGKLVVVRRNGARFANPKDRPFPRSVPSQLGLNGNIENAIDILRSTCRMVRKEECREYN